MHKNSKTISERLAAFWPFWLFHARRLRWVIVLLLIATSFVGYRYGRLIRIDTNLLHLLPKHTASLERLEALRAKSNIKGFLTVTFDASERKSDHVLTQMAKKLESAVEQTPFLKESTESVIYQIPGDFLLRYSLYYADTKDLLRVRDRLNESIAQAKRKENPYFEDLEEKAATPFYVGDILTKYRKKYLKSGSFIDAEQKSIVVLLALRQESDNLSFAKKYLGTLRDAIEPQAKESGFEVSFAGRYVANIEKQKRLAEDITQSTILTLLILTASLVIFFRSLRVLLVVGLPVMAALGYTYFAAWYFIGEISIISSFLTSILLGLGIDYGIHLFARYKGERLRGLGMTESLESTMRGLFRGLSLGMVTTAAVFLTLSFSRFIAFAEFGKIAFAGIVFFFLSFVLFFPVLIFLTERFSFTTTEPSHILEKTKKIRGWQIALIALVTIYGVFTAVHPPFEYDFFELDKSMEKTDEQKDDRQRLMQIIESREHMVVYELDSIEALTEATKNLKRHKNFENAETHSILDLIPSNMAQKKTVLHEIHTLLKQAESYALMELDSGLLKKIRQGLYMTSSQPVRTRDIPAVFTQHLVQGGKYYLYLFPKNTSTFQRGVLDFAEDFREVCSAANTQIDACAKNKKIYGVSDLYVLDDILTTVMRDLVAQILLIVVVIAVTVLSMTRRIAGVLLILTPLVCGLLGLFALLGVSHALLPSWLFELNYINLLAVPILLGIGIDNGIYLYSHARSLGLSQVNRIMVSTGGSIFVSNFTTAMGFLSLTISAHKGLASFGLLTCAGMLCIFYAYRVLFPALARLFEKLDAKI